MNAARPGTPLSQRVALALVSAALAGAAAWLLLPRLRGEVGTVELVDQGAELDALLGERAAAGPVQGMPETLAEHGADFARRLAEELDEQVAHQLFGILKAPGMEYTPGVHFRHRAVRDLWRVFEEHPEGGYLRVYNSLGLREDRDPGDERPDLRLLVTGDSHTEGVCANDESFANGLEVRLAAADPARTVEVWNVGQGGYGPPNYLGTLQAYGDLEPDGLILVLYGGNDFRDGLSTWRFVYRTDDHRPVEGDRGPLRRREDGRALLGQEANQAAYFASNPQAVAIARDATAAVGLELRRRCAERGMDFLFVYLPPPARGQPEHYGERMREALELMGVDPEALAASDRLADEVLAVLEEGGVATLDLRPSFRDAAEPLYWNTDLHLSVAGHRRVAEALERALAELRW